jgi:hypothetical protein
VSRSTQAKFHDALEALAKDAGLELIDDRDYGNTGTYRIQSPDSFASVISMRYNFQEAYAVFEDLHPTDLGDIPRMLRDTAGGPITAHGTHFPYVKPDELESRVLRRVRERLASVPSGR